MHFFHIITQLQRLLELRAFFERKTGHKSIRDLSLNDAEWLQLIEIVKVLEPFNKYTIKLQNGNCTLSDFFGYWTVLTLKLKNPDTPLKVYLLAHMKKYEQDLLENPLVIASIYMDPRYQRILNAEKKETAFTILKTIHQKIEMLSTLTEHTSTEDSNIDSNHQNNNSNSFEDLMQYIDSISNNEQTSANVDKNIDEAIRKFDSNVSTENISSLHYWERKKMNEPALYLLSQAIHSIPPTQSSVERSFSSLPIVLTARRTKISDQCLQKILLMKNNPNI